MQSLLRTFSIETDNIGYNDITISRNFEAIRSPDEFERRRSFSRLRPACSDFHRSRGYSTLLPFSVRTEIIDGSHTTAVVVEPDMPITPPFSFTSHAPPPHCLSDHTFLILSVQPLMSNATGVFRMQQRKFSIFIANVMLRLTQFYCGFEHNWMTGQVSTYFNKLYLLLPSESPQ